MTVTALDAKLFIDRMLLINILRDSVKVQARLSGISLRLVSTLLHNHLTQSYTHSSVMQCSF